MPLKAPLMRQAVAGFLTTIGGQQFFLLPPPPTHQNEIMKSQDMPGFSPSSYQYYLEICGQKHHFHIKTNLNRE